MKQGIITANKARGDVYFINMKGKAILPPSKNVEVGMRESFFGETLQDAIESAQKYAIGAIRQRVEQKMRGHDCQPVIYNVRVNYTIKEGFDKKEIFQKLLYFKKGDCILRKGEQGLEFFFVQEGTVDIEGMEYKSGSVFGRAAFNDGIRKMDVFAKTDVTLVAINKKHPDLNKKITLIVDKFAEETRKIKRMRPHAKIDTIVLN